MEKETEKVYCIFNNKKGDINEKLVIAFKEYLKEKLETKEELE